MGILIQIGRLLIIQSFSARYLSLTSQLDPLPFMSLDTHPSRCSPPSREPMHLLLLLHSLYITLGVVKEVANPTYSDSIPAWGDGGIP